MQTLLALRTLRLELFSLYLVLACTCPLWSQTSSATDPNSKLTSATLARLSFWLPPTHSSQFASAYQRELVPLLIRHNLLPVEEKSRETADGVFCRLLQIETSAALANARRSLEQDSTWQKALRDWAATSGAQDIDYALEIYRAPAGNGKTTIAGAGMHQGLWQSFNVQDGLPSANILSLLQDRHGNIWFGSEAGATRFDGFTLTTFTTADGLVDNNVQSIVEDKQGRLWFGTGTWKSHGSGVSRYDGTTFTTFTSVDGLASNSVQSILEDRQGHMWFGTGTWRLAGQGISRYDGHHFESFDNDDGLPGNTVIDLFLDAEGLLWIATVDWEDSQIGGVCIYKNGEFVPIEGMWALSLSQDKQGDIWFGSLHGIGRYDGEQVIHYSEKLAGPRALLVDEENTVWIGTFGSGVGRYNGANFRRFDNKDGLGGNMVWSLLEDREGHIWIGTHGGGVSRYIGAQFTNIEDGLGYTAKSFQDRQGHMWFATSTGLNRYDGEHLVQYGTEQGLNGQGITYIFTDSKDQMWLGSTNGLFRYDGQSFVCLGYQNTWVNPIFEDRAGTLWFGTSWSGEGVVRYDGQTFTALTTKDGLAENDVWAIEQDSEGYMWFGTRDGVSRYDGQRFQNFAMADGLADTWVKAIKQDREGQLWFGTSAGLHLFDGEKFVPLAGRGDFSANTIQHIAEDAQGHMWFSEYGGGVSRFDGQVLQTLTRRDGLISDAVEHVYRDTDGYVWISTESGVTRYRPSRVPPNIHIMDVITDRALGAVDTLHLTSDASSLIIEFLGDSFTTTAGRLAYVYRLQGYEDAWQTTRKNRVEYTDLTTGDYTFEVKAVDVDLNYSEQAATLALRIRPPYAKIGLWSGLALSLLGLMLATAFGVSRQRAQRQAERNLLQRMERELEEARQMQLSMLPSEKPLLPHIEIAWHMITATEVGGDYYDYALGEDGTLTIILGDATGHGMSAGIMVSATKSLFQNLANEPGITNIFNAMSHSLKNMNLNRMGMALNIVKLTHHTLRISSAGIPPMLLYRAASGQVEEVLIEGMPLGYSASAKYEEQLFALAPGDVVLLMSDGLPERLNEGDEEFFYPRVKALFAEVATAEPEAIVQQLIQGGERWSNGRPQDDDITLVVLKML